MILSGVTDTMGNANEKIALTSSDMAELMYDAKQLIKSLKVNGYNKNEIMDLFNQLSEYISILDEFESVYMEVD